MGEKVLIKGNEAIGEAALRAGCQCFSDIRLLRKLK